MISLIYINRLSAVSEIPITSCNWRPLIFISFLIAHKVADDKVLSNQAFVSVYPFFSLKQLNFLEMKYLELIAFTTHVTFSSYMMYYLELKSLYSEKSLLKPLTLMNIKSLKVQDQSQREARQWSKTLSMRFTEGMFSLCVIS